MTRKLAAIPLALGVALFAASPAKADPLADACAGCHGTDGSSKGAMPSFGGKAKDAILKMLTEYKAGAREATIMDRIVKGYSDAELEAIAAYYSSKTK